MNATDYAFVLRTESRETYSLETSRDRMVKGLMGKIQEVQVVVSRDEKVGEVRVIKTGGTPILFCPVCEESRESGICNSKLCIVRSVLAS